MVYILLVCLIFYTQIYTSTITAKLRKSIIYSLSQKSHYCNCLFHCLPCQEVRDNMLLTFIFLLPTIISSTGRQALFDNAWCFCVCFNVAKSPFWQLYQFTNPQAIMRGSFPFILNKTVYYHFVRTFAILIGLISLIFLYLHF